MMASRAWQAQAELQLTGHDPLLRSGLQQLQLRLIMRRPEMLDLTGPLPRGPRTIFTAVTPDVVCTVRTYGTGSLYGLRLTILNRGNDGGSSQQRPVAHRARKRDASRVPLSVLAPQRTGAM